VTKTPEVISLEPVRRVRDGHRRRHVTDAGDGHGRADPVPGPIPATESPVAEDRSGSLSKRAARRRRKRRGQVIGGSIADTAPDTAKPGTSAGDSERRPLDGPAKARAKRARNRHGRARKSEPATPVAPRNPAVAPASIRGVRQAAPVSTPQTRGQHPAADPRPPAPQADSIGGLDPMRRPAGTRPHTPRRGSGGPLYAALDLGTNNCRLLVAEPQERGFRVVDAFSRIVRLGEGVGRSGRLSEAAMDRAVEALAICRMKMDELEVRRMRLIATEACRLADNGPVFLGRVLRETGLDLEIVSRETEARLAVAGCATLVDPAAEGVVLFDIGGGSSELVWLDLRNRGNARGFGLTRFIKAWTSLPVGVVTLSERHGGMAVTPEIFADMVDEVVAMLDGFEGVEELGRLVAEGRIHMLGTSGTVTTLAGIHLGLKRYDRRRVDGVWLAGSDVDAMISQLIAMGFEERVANPCIGSDRADLVLAGCAILEAIRRRWPCERLRVADRGLREGILVELMARDGVWRRRPTAPQRA
jgi:exopolyphosphatase/guanosine-5'-triphosphate,3'-diphosphate pyrophosphatase